MIYLELRDGLGIAKDLSHKLNAEGPIFGPYKLVNCDRGIIRCEKDDDVYILACHMGKYYYDGEWYAGWKVWEEKRMRRLPSLRDRCMPFVQQYASLPGHVYEEKFARSYRRL